MSDDDERMVEFSHLNETNYPEWSMKMEAQLIRPGGSGEGISCMEEKADIEEDGLSSGRDYLEGGGFPVATHAESGPNGDLAAVGSGPYRTKAHKTACVAAAVYASGQKRRRNDGNLGWPREGKISKPAPAAFEPTSIKQEPLPQTSSGSNMFSMLSRGSEAAMPGGNLRSRKASADLSYTDISEAAPQRKLIVLLPRSKPIDTGVASRDGQGAGPSQHPAELSSPSLSPSSAQQTGTQQYHYYLANLPTRAMQRPSHVPASAVRHIRPTARPHHAYPLPTHTTHTRSFHIQ
ncbi:hypothetical protein BD779DRAFT_1670768 [Infundibulicybe gibba]|nr:hypothetical protein BD779DRAFT_1670768 [Infundibulicybe gibba]